MNTILRILRDPIWQIVSLLVAVIAIFISTSGIQVNRSELSVVPLGQKHMADNWLPNEHFKLLVQGAKKDMGNVVENYYSLINESSNPIHPSDFIVPLEIHPSGSVKQILSVESCSKPLAEQCSVDGSSTSDGGSYVPIKWVQKLEKWVAEPLLLNKGDQVCVLIVSELVDSSKSTLVFPAEWAARISNVQLKVYPSSQAYYAQRTSWIDYLWITVFLQGIGVYWFVLLQCVIFVVTAALAVRNNWLNLRSRIGMLQCVLVLLFCTSTSEILVDIFVNKSPNLHPVVWPLLTVHVLFIVVLVYRSLRINRLSP